MSLRSAERCFLGVVVASLLGPGAGASWAQSGQTNYVVLLWTAPGDDGNVGRATSYDIRYRTADISGTDTTSWWNGATQVSGEPSPGTSGATDSVRVQGLTAGQTHYFMIRASDEVPNQSGYSNMASALPNVCNVPTETPQVSTPIEDNGDALLSWASVTDPIASSIQIYRGTGTGSLAPLTTLGVGQTSYRDASVVPGGTYRYQVSLASTCGEGPKSSIVSITMTGPPPPPPPPPPTPEPSVRAYPNPSSGAVSIEVNVTGSSTAPVMLRLFDATGRVMSIIADSSLPPGQRVITWSRISQSGGRVAPGYYELIGSIGSTRVRERLILLP